MPDWSSFLECHPGVHGPCVRTDSITSACLTETITTNTFPHQTAQRHEQRIPETNQSAGAAGGLYLVVSLNQGTTCQWKSGRRIISTKFQRRTTWKLVREGPRLARTSSKSTLFPFRFNALLHACALVGQPLPVLLLFKDI